jgi:hypothetical protein
VINMYSNSIVKILCQAKQEMHIVGTLRTGYPRVQASSQDNDSCLPAGGSSRATTCPRSSGSHLPAQGSSGAAMCPHGSGSHLPAGEAPGLPHVTWAPAPTFRLRAAPELPRVSRMGSTGCKQINKYPLVTQPS